MSTRMRAKFVVNTVTKYTTGESLEMFPVIPSSYGPNGENEDNYFARFTPSGSLKITINNPDLIGKIQPGETYYLDFTLA